MVNLPSALWFLVASSRVPDLATVPVQDTLTIISAISRVDVDGKCPGRPLAHVRRMESGLEEMRVVKLYDARL